MDNTLRWHTIKYLITGISETHRPIKPTNKVAGKQILTRWAGQSPT